MDLLIVLVLPILYLVFLTYIITSLEKGNIYNLTMTVCNRLLIVGVGIALLCTIPSVVKIYSQIILPIFFQIWALCS